MVLAIFDAKNWTMVDVGQYGSKNDSGVLINSEMNQKFEESSFDFPKVKSLEKYLIG